MFILLWLYECCLQQNKVKYQDSFFFTGRPTSWPQSHSKKNVPRVKFKFILKKLTSPIVFSMSHSFSNASIVLHNPPVVPLFWSHLPTLVWTCCSLGLMLAGILKQDIIISQFGSTVFWIPQHSLSWFFVYSVLLESSNNFEKQSVLEVNFQVCAVWKYHYSSLSLDS